MNEVVRLLLGDPDRHMPPKTKTEIMQLLDCTRPTIYRYIEIAKNKKMIEVDEMNNLKLPESTQQELDFIRYNKDNDFIKDPLIAEWIQDLMNRRQGKPRKAWSAMVSTLESVCNTTKIRPRQLLVNKETTEKILKNFADLYRKGQAESKRGVRKNADPQGAVHVRTMAIRDFCGFHGITWRRGVSGIMSGKIIGHGKYADVRLTTQELEMADRFIKEKWGIDSDEFRFFWMGVETCARLGALLTMPLEWVEHESAKTGKTTFIMTVIETKTEHIKGGKWTKYIRNPDLQESLRAHKEKKCYSKIYSENKSESFVRKICNALREIYKHVGKQNQYFYQKPFHTLRHIGAQKYLGEYDFNYGLVAQVGGWNVIDELKNSYGEMPPEKVLELLENKAKELEIVA